MIIAGIVDSTEVSEITFIIKLHVVGNYVRKISQKQKVTDKIRENQLLNAIDSVIEDK